MTSSQSVSSPENGRNSSGDSLAHEIHNLTGVDPARCYQCGKCTAGCPMANEMAVGPHAMIRLIQLDRRDRLMRDESKWLCLTCETCTSRCPNEIDPARLIDGLREIAFRDHREKTPARIRAFHESFLNQIRMFGRMYELGLVIWYKTKSGALFDDVATAPGLITRGKLNFLPHGNQDIASIRRIFEACVEGKDHK